MKQSARPCHEIAHQTIPILAERQPIDGQPAAYVCHDFVCDLPTTDPAVLRKQLGLTEE